MLLPKQSPPVPREKTLPAQSEKSAVKPQVVCECRTVNGVTTLWCLIGRNFYNTGQPC